MNRREFLKVSGVVSLLQLRPRIGFASPTIRRVRSCGPWLALNAAWKRLHDAVDGNLVPVEFPINYSVSYVVGKCRLQGSLRQSEKSLLQ